MTGIKGLSRTQLAGANLAGAKLPDEIGKFTELDRTGEISKHGRTVQFTYILLACVLSWLTIMSATDMALVTNSSVAPLPVVQANVPIANFFYLVPIALLVIYLYFHVYLQEYRQALSSLCFASVGIGHFPLIG